MTLESYIAIIVLLTVYGFLFTEKINKVIVVASGALFLILIQVFKTATESSQVGAFTYVAKNLDMLGFILGMMLLVGIVKDSGVFEAIAIWLVKAVKGRPIPLLVAMSIFTLITSIILPNIIAMIIVAPILVIMIKEFKFPALPYFLGTITMANIGGATTPISDPTTYYEAKTVGLGFMEVVQNSAPIVLALAIISLIYICLMFGKSLRRIKVNAKELKAFNPKAAIKNTRLLKIGTPILFITILIMILKENIFHATGVYLDDATVALSSGIICMILFKVRIEDVFSKLIDWETLFFFMGLFIIIGALQHTGVVKMIAQIMISVTKGNVSELMFILAMFSGILSTFIDNVPYNMAMIGAIQEMAKAGIAVYPLWWILNLGTSLGGAGSPIGSAANVVAISMAEKEKIHIAFFKYLMYGVPLVIINSLATFAIIYLRFH